MKSPSQLEELRAERLLGNGSCCLYFTFYHNIYTNWLLDFQFDIWNISKHRFNVRYARSITKTVQQKLLNYSLYLICTEQTHLRWAVSFLFLFSFIIFLLLVPLPVLLYLYSLWMLSLIYVVTVMIIDSTSLYIYFW